MYTIYRTFTYAARVLLFLFSRVYCKKEALTRWALTFFSAFYLGVGGGVYVMAVSSASRSRDASGLLGASARAKFTPVRTRFRCGSVVPFGSSGFGGGGVAAAAVVCRVCGSCCPLLCCPLLVTDIVGNWTEMLRFFQRF